MDRDILKLNLHLIKYYIKPIFYIFIWYISIGLILVAQQNLDLAIKTWSEIMYLLTEGFKMYLYVMIIYWALWSAIWIYQNKIKEDKQT